MSSHSAFIQPPSRVPAASDNQGVAFRFQGRFGQNPRPVESLTSAASETPKDPYEEAENDLSRRESVEGAWEEYEEENENLGEYDEEGEYQGDDPDRGVELD